MGLASGLWVGSASGHVATRSWTGAAPMVYAALMVGRRAQRSSWCSTQARVVDTIVKALVTPLARLPAGVFAGGWRWSRPRSRCRCPAVPGARVDDADLVPLSDLLGLPRQVTVLASRSDRAAGSVLADGRDAHGGARAGRPALRAVAALCRPALRRALCVESCGDRGCGSDQAKLNLACRCQSDRGNPLPHSLRTSLPSRVDLRPIRRSVHSLAISR